MQEKSITFAQLTHLYTRLAQVSITAGKTKNAVT